MGYRLEEIQGKHHQMFVAPSERDSAADREFWAKLGRGEYEAAEYKRFGKGGKEVWIFALPGQSDPGRCGKPFKVVKFASDVTADKLKTKLRRPDESEAIGKSQAAIEFSMDGHVLMANANFLGALGYSLAEIQGKHHSTSVHRSRARWRGLPRVLGQSEPRRVSVG